MIHFLARQNQGTSPFEEDEHEFQIVDSRQTRGLNKTGFQQRQVRQSLSLRIVICRTRLANSNVPAAVATGKTSSSVVARRDARNSSNSNAEADSVADAVAVVAVCSD